jgi:hypothetical protein
MSEEHQLRQALADLADAAPPPLRGIDELVAGFRHRMTAWRWALGLGAGMVLVVVIVIRRAARARS